jgi:hypothetical protein
MFLYYACLDPLTQRTFLVRAYSGRWSESSVMAECLKQYGFHFLTLSKYPNFYLRSPAIDPPSTSRLMRNRNLSKTCQIVSGFIGAQVYRLQINLALDSFLNGCLLIKSRT